MRVTRRLTSAVLSTCVACGGAAADPAPGSTGMAVDTGTGSTADPTASTSAADGEVTVAPDPDPSGADSTTGTPTSPACDPDALAGHETIVLDAPSFSRGDDPSADPSCTEVRNPGRGFYRTMDLRDADPDELAQMFADGHRLAYGRVLIPEYVDAPIDDTLLGELDEGFDRIRDAGLQVIPRVYYPDNQDDPDAALDVVLGHIAQLGPTWQAHGDVLAVVQAGFIGAWGEWHGSMNGLDEPGARAQILEALLDAVPADRMIEVRRPSFKQAAFGGPLDVDTAHGDDALARIAHHNDCFLASDDDYGTYQERGERAYLEADAPFTFNGGETCAVNPPRSECASALDELALLHFTTLNLDYHLEVLQSWRDDGCFAQIECRLGYRLLVTQVRAPASATPGSTIGVEIEVLNDGFAAIQNPRPFVLQLRSASGTLTQPIDVDPRTFAPGVASTFCVAIDLPADATGDHTLALHMPGASATLADRSEYAVRLANTQWDEASGTNVLPAVITVP